jgi:hypothetical protein
LISQVRRGAEEGIFKLTLLSLLLLLILLLTLFPFVPEFGDGEEKEVEGVSVGGELTFMVIGIGEEEIEEGFEFED